MDIYEYALDLLKQHPEKANTPMGKELLKVLESKDYSKGEQMAHNICKTYGVEEAKAVEAGKQFFGL